jgi:hypothetical protein
MNLEKKKALQNLVLSVIIFNINYINAWVLIVSFLSRQKEDRKGKRNAQYQPICYV